MTNLFAFRATDPKIMKAQKDPIGPDNDKWLLSVCEGSALTVAAWGIHGSFLGRGERVKELLKYAQCLGVNRDGSPKHPLYLSKKTELVNYV